MKTAYLVSIPIISYLFATDVYTPSMPDIALFFNESSDRVQTTLTAFMAGAIFSTFMAPKLSKTFGRSNALRLGVILAGVCSMSALFAQNLNHLIFIRFLQGAFGAFAPIIGFAIIQSTYDKKDRLKAFGIIGI